MQKYKEKENTYFYNSDGNPENFYKKTENSERCPTTTLCLSSNSKILESGASKYLKMSVDK